MMQQRQANANAQVVPPARLQWKIKSDPANLRAVRVELEEFAGRAGADEAAIHSIGLCVNEALANVIRHGYGGRHDQPVEITADSTAGEIRVAIRDWAAPIDPSKLPTAPKDPLVPGGLGLLCMRRMMDDVQFIPQSDGNLLTMVKKTGRV
jgi:anti-sigma regulatory factor (Ser/Thr protein kinase)